MELCPKGFSTISQLFSESVSDAKSGGWHLFNPPAQRSEVICPEPRRACRVPVMVDGLNRFSCKPRSLNMRIGDGDLEIVDILLSMDDLEFDPDKCGRAGFFQGSPPVRTSNPIVRDVEFARQSITTGSPLGMTALGSKTTSPRVDRGVPSCGSPLSGKPKIRVEGFSSSNSKSGCVVSARA